MSCALQSSESDIVCRHVVVDVDWQLNYPTQMRQARVFRMRDSCLHFKNLWRSRQSLNRTGQ